MILLNAFSTFSPLFFSSGTAFVVARRYTQCVSRLWAAIAVFAWCVSECSTGLALLSFLHSSAGIGGVAASTHSTTVGYVFVAGIPLLWLTASIALLCRAVLTAFVACLLNLVSHYIFLGVLLPRIGFGAAVLIVFATVWLLWSMCFSVAVLLMIRKSFMKRFSDATIKLYQGSSGFSYRPESTARRRNVPESNV